MKILELKQANIGIIISELEGVNPPLSFTAAQHLQKSIRADLTNMYNAWWKTHFPFYDYAIRIETAGVSEPCVTMRWTDDHNNLVPWYELKFHFAPVRIIKDNYNDPIAAYDRAMAII